jgi:hypothetical protein
MTPGSSLVAAPSRKDRSSEGSSNHEPPGRDCSSDANCAFSCFEIDNPEHSFPISRRLSPHPEPLLAAPDASFWLFAKRIRTAATNSLRSIKLRDRTSAAEHGQSVPPEPAGQRMPDESAGVSAVCEDDSKMQSLTPSDLSDPFGSFRLSRLSAHAGRIRGRFSRL